MELEEVLVTRHVHPYVARQGFVGVVSEEVGVVLFFFFLERHLGEPLVPESLLGGRVFFFLQTGVFVETPLEVLVEMGVGVLEDLGLDSHVAAFHETASLGTEGTPHVLTLFVIFQTVVTGEVVVIQVMEGVCLVELVTGDVDVVFADLAGEYLGTGQVVLVADVAPVVGGTEHVSLLELV